METIINWTLNNFNDHDLLVHNSYERFAELKMPKLQRFMPFVTVVFANCINLPVSRRTELVDETANDFEAMSYCWLPLSNPQKVSSINTAGLPLYDDAGNLVGLSPEMGRTSIQQARFTLYRRCKLATVNATFYQLIIGRFLTRLHGISAHVHSTANY